MRRERERRERIIGMEERESGKGSRERKRVESAGVEEGESEGREEGGKEEGR